MLITLSEFSHLKTSFSEIIKNIKAAKVQCRLELNIPLINKPFFLHSCKQEYTFYPKKCHNHRLNMKDFFIKMSKKQRNPQVYSR